MLARSTLIYGPAILAPRAAAFGLVLMLTHGLTRPEFGLYALVAVVGELLDMSASNWIRFSLLRIDIAKPEAWRDGLRRSLVLLAGALLASAALAAGASAMLAPERFAAFALATIAYVVSNGVLRLGLTLLQLQERRAAYSAVEVGRSLLLLGSAALALSLSARFEMVVLANALVTGLFAVGCLLYGLRSLPRGAVQAAPFKERLLYGLPIIAISLVAYLVGSSDRVFLKLFLGAGSVGAYAAAYALAKAPMDMVGNAVNQGGFPELMRRYEEGGAAAAAAFLRQSFELLSLLILAVGGMSVALAEPLASAALNASYRATATQLIPIIAVAAALLALKTFVFDNAFHALKRNWLQTATYAPVALLTVVACFGLIPRMGVVGAGLAFAIGSAAGLATSAACGWRMLGLRFSATEFGKALACAVAAGLAGHWVGTIAFHGPALARFCAGAVAGGAVWAGTLLLLRPAASTPFGVTACSAVEPCRSDAPCRRRRLISKGWRRRSRRLVSVGGGWELWRNSVGTCAACRG